MTAVVTSNTIFGRDNRAPAPSVKEDGSNYAWRMFFDDNQRIVDADTTEELLDYLIQNYTLLSTEEKKVARLSLAQQVQVLARAAILASITPEEAENITDWEWDVLTYGEGNDLDPHGWGDGTGTIGVENEETLDLWNIDHPLVLVDTSYVPFTDIDTPLSIYGDYKEVKNIIWLRPTTEEGLLRSLSRIGFISFGTPTATVNGE